ncbi:hypothetical protein X777_04051 [Ooceraea biroi]|uniref:Uncharacterized protein n=1 Tax=Ooceraea biroi TaxID=2015173 RepID=A0A026X202_OOCBI|nr:hypothetical protein X777_04051 [Ooceraea biroi]
MTLIVYKKELFKHVKQLQLFSAALPLLPSKTDVKPVSMFKAITLNKIYN